MNFLIRFFTRLNAYLVRATGGRLGGQLGQQSILLLTAAGRHSGQPRTAPLSYYRDGTHYLVVASNWGKPGHPDWLLNLRRQPRATILVAGQSVSVLASEAKGDEYVRLWQLVTGQNSQFLAYQKKAARQIPVVILTPVDAPA